AKVRGDNDGVLLIDAGNAFFGADSIASNGKVIVAAYQAMAYDAVNLSWRDFRSGKEQTLNLLKDSKLAVVSANLQSESDERLLMPPFVVKVQGKTKIAIIGVTDSPAGIDFLPHLKEQLAGVRIRPPVEALA